MRLKMQHNPLKRQIKLYVVVFLAHIPLLYMKENEN